MRRTYTMPMGLPKRFRWLLMLPVAGLSACATPIVTGQSAGCSSLIPSEWERGVDPADLPSGNTVADWVAFGDAQTGRLDMANDRTVTTIGIVKRCEARDAAAIKSATRRKSLGVF
jgi:hypothetical protein